MGRKDTERNTIRAVRQLYQEPDIRGHFGNPDRHGAGPGCPWEVELVRTHVPAGGHILVVGCGGGEESFAFAAVGYTVTGVDIVPEFIEGARRHAVAKGLANRTAFELVDGFEWPVSDGSCDGVSMLRNFLTYLPSRAIRRAVFTESVRVLAPGGAVLMECPDRTHPGRRQPAPAWEPDRPDSPALLAEWGLAGEPGVAAKPHHPCRGDANAHTLVPIYEGDPREVWEEVESCDLRVVRLQREEDHAARNPTFTMVAFRD